MTAVDPFVGRDLLDGRFKIIEKVGSGGMSAVYTALQRDMNRHVAVKILHPKLSARKDLVARLRREARAMSQISHPNVTNVFLFGELDDGSIYVVMELLEGRNVNEKPIPINLRVTGRTFSPLLTHVIDKTLAKDPADRFASAAELADALRASLGGHALPVPLARNRTKLVLALVLAFVVGVALTAAVMTAVLR